MGGVIARVLRLFRAVVCCVGGVISGVLRLCFTHLVGAFVTTKIVFLSIKNAQNLVGWLRLRWRGNFRGFASLFHAFGWCICDS